MTHRRRPELLETEPAVYLSELGWIRSSEVAEILDISLPTVTDWWKRGVLGVALVEDATGNRFYSKAAIQAIADGYDPSHWSVSAIPAIKWMADLGLSATFRDK